MSRGRVIAIVIAGVVLGLLVAAELIIPAAAENEIESRLTEGGGTADVSVSSFPSERLLFSSGDQLEVDGRDLNLDLTDDEVEVFDTLDGFDNVRVELQDSKTGPLEIDTFVLEREGEENYSMTSSLTTSLADLGEFGAEALGIPGSGIIGGLLGLAGGVSTQVPVELDMQLSSEDGQVEVVSGGGTVAGIPTGPLAEILVGAIVSRL